MIPTFIDWLNNIFATLKESDPFYRQRLAAFNKLNHPHFLSSQKERCTMLREMISLLAHQTDDSYSSFNPLLPLTIDNYGIENEAIKINFVNGIWLPSGACYQGFQLRRVTDLPIWEQEEVCRLYMANIASSDDLFVLLNTVLSQSHYVLEVEPGTQQMIILEHTVTNAYSHIVPQVLLKVGQASMVKLVESWHNPEQKVSSFINNSTHILLERRAHLAYYTLHMQDVASCQVNNIYCNQEECTSFSHHAFAFGGSMLRLHLNLQLTGSHADGRLYGLSLLSGREKMEQQIQVRHSAPSSVSQQYYKSMLNDESSNSFSGSIYLESQAQQTNTYQTSNALMLSDKARYYTKPQLEIYADDVKCSHGATTGQLDQEQLFYLQTRGIAAPLAKKLLLEAFGKQIIQFVDLLPLQNYLSDKLLEKLEKL